MSGFVKHDQGKLDWSLLFHPDLVVALEELVHVLALGAKNYGNANWTKCEEPERYFSAMMRHVVKYRKGEPTDHESGKHHLAHAAVCVLFQLALELRGTDIGPPACGYCGGMGWLAGERLGLTTNAQCERCKGTGDA